jgi:hypothetical protein
MVHEYLPPEREVHLYALDDTCISLVHKDDNEFVQQEDAEARAANGATYLVVGGLSSSEVVIVHAWKIIVDERHLQ